MLTIRLEWSLSTHQLPQDYKLFIKTCVLNFMPYPGLKWNDGGMDVPITVKEVMYHAPTATFLCVLEDKCVNTQRFEHIRAGLLASRWETKGD